MEKRGDQQGLVRAMRHILPRHPDARLVLAGDGTMRPRVEETVRRLGLESQVRLLGSVDRPETVYRAIEIYVQASAVREGTSNSIIEAMASGRPVVAVDLGGNREVVVDGETGLLVPPGDERSLAAALLALLDDPERARRLGAAGAARARALYSRPALVARSLQAWEAARRSPAPV
jgi:glycosyltransferase involved in cell wall biosynthesis